MRRIALPLLLLLALPTLALAGGTAVHEVTGHASLAEGELEALSLDAEGVLRPGPAFDALPLDAPNAWCAVPSGENLWIGTGNTGDLLQVDPQGEVLRIPLGERAVLVTALAASRGGVVAAVFPGAHLVTVDAAGQVEPLATLPVEHVWALKADERGGFLAATGAPGAIYRVDAFGAVEKVVDVDDDHARVLALDGDVLYVGTAPKGRVLRVRDGKVRVVRDLEPQEVVGIVPLDDGGLLVAANTDTVGGNQQKIASVLTQIANPPATRPGQKPQPRASLQNGVALWLEPGGAVTTLWSGTKVAALSLTRTGAGAVLGTYPSGRLVEILPGAPARLLADLPEAEASVVLGGEQGLEAVVTSNPVVLHRRATAPPAGTWTSAPLDAGTTARWGRLRLSGRGVESLAWRSGETKEPDATWSDWTPVSSFDTSGGGCPTRARFLQVRVGLAGADALLRGVSVVVVTPNRTPVVAELTVARKDEKKNDVGLPGATTLRTIQWKAEDADGDRLRVRLTAQRVDSPHAIVLVDDEVLAKAEHTWDTAGAPDGEYVFRLEASDAPDTPPDTARSVARTTPPVRIDNTPPLVKVTARVAAKRLLVSGEGIDQSGGRIALLRVSIDGAAWQVLAPADGIADEAAEGYEASLPLPASGAHDVVVQVWDAEGNVGAAAAIVTVR